MAWQTMSRESRWRGLWANGQAGWMVLTLLLCVLALPPLALPGMGLVCFIPALLHCFAQGRASWITGAVLGLFLGSLIYFGAWGYSGYLASAIILIMTMGCAGLFYALGRLAQAPGWAWCGGVAVLAAGLEAVLQAITLPFSWVILISSTPILIQPLAGVGPLGVSAGLFGLQAAGARVLWQWQRHQPYQALLVGLVLSLSGVLGYGYWQLLPAATPPSSGAALVVAAIQTNLPPYQYTHLERPGYLEQLQQTREQMLKQVFALSSPKPAVVVWPEVDFAGFEWRQRQPPIQAWVQRYQTPMLMASADINAQGEVFNSIFSISAQGQVLQRHDKQHLIPWAETGLTAGAVGRVPIHSALPGQPLSLVCVESGLPLWATRWFSAPELAGTEWIGIATSDAYAGHSWLPWFHLEFAKIWAVSWRKPVIRAANGGISAIIDPQGRTLADLPLYTAGVISATIPRQAGRSWFMRHALWIHGLLLGCGGMVLLYLLWRPAHGVVVVSGRVLGVVLVSTASVLMVQYFSMVALYRDRAVVAFDDPWMQQEIAPQLATQVEVKENDEENGFYEAMGYWLRYYGLAVTPSVLRYNVPNIAASTDWIVQQGFQVNAVTPLQTAMYTPALARLASGEYVVITEIDDHAVSLFSPHRGQLMQVSRSAFLSRWNGYLWWLSGQPKSWDN